MSAVPNLFRGDYEREIERVWRIPEPIDEQTGLKAEKGAPQKVLFPSTVMPRVPRAKWMAAQPTWKEMWNAQEDLWLMSQLLMAITRTNADAGSIADANVRQIRKIQLFGGERAAAGSSTTPGGAGGMGGSDPGMMAGAPGMPVWKNLRSIASTSGRRTMAASTVTMPAFSPAFSQPRSRRAGAFWRSFVAPEPRSISTRSRPRLIWWPLERTASTS